MRHILVIRLSALGDVALLAPVLRRRAEANPDVRFTVAAPPMLEPLFGGMDNVTFLGLKKQQSSWRIFRALKAVGSAEVADLHVVNRVGRALILLQLDRWLHLDFRFRIFELDKGRRSRRRMLSHRDMTPRRPQWQRYDDVFARMGLEKSENREAKSESHKLMATDSQTRTPNAQPTVGVAPFSQHDGKVWPLELTERLVAMLANAGYNVLLFGSKSEAATLEQWAAKYSGVTSVAGKHGFADELSLIASLDLMVSMDSANMHFASAVGTRVVSVWGATHPDFGFYGYGQDRADALCANLSCQPCSAFGQRPCRYGDHRCLRAIAPEAVFERVQKILALQRN